MIPAEHKLDALAIGTPLHLLRRFRIDVVDTDSRTVTVTMTLSLEGMYNPVTGAPTVGPLGLLVDAVGGLVNHLRRGTDEWTVTTELAYELSAGAGMLAALESGATITATGRAVGPKGFDSLTLCTLNCGRVTIGTATVRSYFIRGKEVDTSEPEEALELTAATSLGDRLAVHSSTSREGETVLVQHHDPMLLNAVGIVNGGIASTALELIASAVANGNPDRLPLLTKSFRVSFLRPFLAGAHPHYRAAAVRLGNATGFVDAEAVNDDGQVAVSARLTAYR